jgi:putative transcriptional regulator
MSSVETDTGSRPVDALLAGYALGTLSRPLSVLVESHLCLNTVNRGYVAALEALCGVVLSETTGKPLSKRDERLAAIFALDDRDAAPPIPMIVDPVLPSPLARFIGHGLDRVSWKSVMPGLKEHRLSDEASLLWIGAGRRMPNHTHEGTEATLVLKGSFSDLTGEYLRGDIAIGDEDLDHRPIAGTAEDCICFVVNDAPLRLTGPVGRFIELFRRH